MPKYFFNVHNGRVIADDDGIDLSGPAEARERGVRLAADILREEMATSPDASWRMIVTDDAGDRVFQIDFSISGFDESGKR